MVLVSLGLVITRDQACLIWTQLKSLCILKFLQQSGLFDQLSIISSSRTFFVRRFERLKISPWLLLILLWDSLIIPTIILLVCKIASYIKKNKEENLGREIVKPLSSCNIFANSIWNCYIAQKNPKGFIITYKQLVINIKPPLNTQ